MKKHLWRVLLAALWLALPARIAAAQTGQEAGQLYVVQINDSLWKLAEKYLGDGHRYPDIVRATNTMAAQTGSLTPIADSALIVPGQKLWIPGTQTAPVPEAAASAAAPAPEGHIAFAFWNDHPNRCTYEINIISVPDCLQNPATCQAERRVFALNNVSEPALSPDGSRLAFRGWGEPPSPDSPFLGCAPAHPFRYLGHSALDGSDFVGMGGFWEDSHPDWSPDGSRLIFDSSRHEDRINRIYTISADGSREENMFITGQHPSWAPDNRRFVYRGCDISGNRCGLWAAVAVEPKSWEAGSNMLGPIVQAGQVAHPDWSPRRDEIVYQQYEADNWNLWLVDAGGSNNRRLTDSPGLEGLPAWSPDGNWVAYLTHNGQAWQIRVVARGEDEDRLVFTFDGGIYVVPSPDEPYGSRDWIDEQISWSK
ncbi:MAG: LysM peptidoglycan-binding domain-containing protein [Anaerolineae bacterium]